MAVSVKMKKNQLFFIFASDIANWLEISLCFLRAWVSFTFVSVKLRADISTWLSPQTEKLSHLSYERRRMGGKWQS